MKKAMTYDATEFLETDADIIAYLKAALEEGDSALLAAALGDVARARGNSAQAFPRDVQQPRYNAATEAAMREAEEIMSGKLSAETYDSVEAMFAALDK